MSVLFIVFAVFVFTIIPNMSFAWGPTVHIGVSLSALEEAPAYVKILLFSNLSEYLYGTLAPDFIVGKNLSPRDKHTHNWRIGFGLLENSKSNREKAFAYGYIMHLAADTVIHSLILNNSDTGFKNLRHAYIELMAESIYDSSYKELAKKTLSSYNADLDERFKNMVDSVLFSFPTSKFIFKGMLKVSLRKEGFYRVLFNRKVSNFFSIEMSSIKNYIELSKEFALDVLLKGENSPVLKLDAVSD